MPSGSGSLIAIDTNLLVYAHRAGLAEHEAALRALEAARNHGSGWGVPFPVLGEFWRVVAGAAAGEHPSTPAQAAGFLSDLWAAGAQPWLPLAGFEHEMPTLANRLNVKGVQVHDLQIAITALQHGARELWTHDCAFLPFPGLRLRDPLLRR